MGFCWKYEISFYNEPEKKKSDQIHKLAGEI